MSATTRIRTDRQDVTEVEVEIPEFLSLDAKGGDSVESDAFHFVDERFQILTVKGGVKRTFPIVIRRYTLENECSVSLGFGIKKKNGEVENVEHISNLTFLTHEYAQGFDFPSFSRDVLQRRRSELLPSGMLTLVFTLRTADVATGTTATGNGVSCSLPTGTHPGPLPSDQFRQEGAAMSPTTTTRILTDRLLEVELKIPDFLSLHSKGDGIVWTDKFFGDRFRLGVSPGTGRRKETFSIYIDSYKRESECNLVLCFGIKKKNGQVENVAHIWNLTFLRHEFSRWFKFPSFSRDVLERRRSELLPSGVLTLVFTLRISNLANGTTAMASPCCEPSSPGGSPHIVETSTQTESENSDEMIRKVREDLSKSTDASIQTEADTDLIDFSEGKQPVAAVQDMKVLHDLKRLLLSGENCDVALLVKGQKFEAHRAILAARSPVFACMLSHNMKEKNTGVVDIVDCDPEYFPDFLHFLYCGSVDSITSQNACSLYRAADKYDVADLKSQSLAFIKSHLDVDCFCEVITLALQHSERDLIKQATDFFVKNALEIVLTVKWQVFLTENPTQGNELIIKGFSVNKS